MSKIIHVHQHRIRRNIQKCPADMEPPIVVKRNKYKNDFYAFEIAGEGKWKMVYSPDKPLNCGARLYMVADGEIIKIR